MSASEPERVAFFGGSFNPPHVGHVLAATYVLATGAVDRVLVAPVAQHVFGKDLETFEHRVAMCELAFRDVAGSEISAVESELPPPNRTLDTLRFLEGEHPDWRLRLMVGADALEEADRWHRFDEVCRVAPRLPLGRIGVPRDDAPAPVLPGVSSTRVRELLASRDGSDFGSELDRAVPRTVLDYIAAEGLYR